MFYFLGSLLFALAMMAALAVMAVNFAHYRRAMINALRSLSIDGFAVPPKQTSNVSLPRQVLAIGSQQAAA